jgi:hypothetical protein
MSGKSVSRPSGMLVSQIWVQIYMPIIPLTVQVYACNGSCTQLRHDGVMANFYKIALNRLVFHVQIFS